MARIRTIKPEFPQSQSMGRVSREARLCFVNLWTLSDDSGRLRGNSRMLASLLFPYDDDAPSLIDTWLGELEKQSCVRRYCVNDKDYVEIINWLEHQKIDKPTKSKLPAFDEASRIVSKPREVSSEDLDQGPRTKEGTKDQGDTSSAVASDPPLPTDEALGLWNELASDLRLPQVQRLSRARTAALNARLRECGGIGGWVMALAKIRGSPFLRGELPRGKGHENWRCNLDWLVSQSGFTKLMEGNFDGGHANYQNGFIAILAEAEQRARERDLDEQPALESTVIDAG